MSQFTRENLLGIPFINNASLKSVGLVQQESFNQFSMWQRCWQLKDLELLCFQKFFV